MTVVVCAEALKETHREPAILGCPVCELMPCPMVDAGWDRDILVNVEGRGQTLREYVRNVVVAIGAVVKFDAKGALPLLCLQNMVRVGRMKDEALKVDLAYVSDLGSRLEVYVQVIADAIGTLEETYLRVEVRTNFAVLAGDLKPIRLIIEPSSEIGLSSGSTWRPRLCGVTVHNQVLKEDETSVCSARLVEMIQGIA